MTCTVASKQKWFPCPLADGKMCYLVFASWYVLAFYDRLDGSHVVHNYPSGRWRRLTSFSLFVAGHICKPLFKSYRIRPRIVRYWNHPKTKAARGFWFLMMEIGSFSDLYAFVQTYPVIWSVVPIALILRIDFLSSLCNYTYLRSRRK